MEDLIEKNYVFVFKHPEMEETTQIPAFAVIKKQRRQRGVSFDFVIMVARWIYLIVL